MTLPAVTFPTLGWQVIDWIETYLPHGPGDVQGQPLVLDDEVALFICWLYRLHPKGGPNAGRRLATRSIFSRPKGRAKSEIAGALVCAEALGPVRFDGWDANGEPVGKPVQAPFIRCLATEEDQSGNTYDNVSYMLTEGRVADEYALDVGLTRTFIREAGRGEIVPSTSGAASKDGGKETFAVADETHLYTTPILRQMYGTVSRNLAKRKGAEPHMLDTTTMFAMGENSVAERAFAKYAHIPVEECLRKNGVLFDHRQGDEPKRFHDNRSLKKALRSGYGPAAEWMDFDRIVQAIRDAEDPERDAYRYFLNRPRHEDNRWISPAIVDKALTEEALTPGEPIALGFDGSESSDHTALIAVNKTGVMQPIGIWAPIEGQESDWAVPREDVTAAVDWAFENFRVVRFEGDPPFWATEMGEWAAKHGSPPVIEFHTKNWNQMGPATGAYKTDLRSGEIRINPVELFTDNRKYQGKPLFLWHLDNAHQRKHIARLDDDAEEVWVLKKDRPGSPRKIDSVTASVLAARARRMALAGNLFDPPEKTEYRVFTW